VNYSGAPLRIPEGGELSLESPGAPDTVWWHTSTDFAPAYLNPFLGLFIGLL
jgi:hypothetical protein